MCLLDLLAIFPYPFGGGGRTLPMMFLFPILYMYTCVYVCDICMCIYVCVSLRSCSLLESRDPDDRFLINLGVCLVTLQFLELYWYTALVWVCKV